MKKNTLFILILISNIALSKAQSPYYDAVNLRKYIALSTGKFNPDNIDKVDTILSHYLKDKFQTVSITFGTDNPFTKNLFENGAKHNAIPFSPTTFVSSAGELDVTNLTDGFAKFIVKRTKQELSIAFFEQFKEDLENTRQIQILFPATYNALIAIDQEIYNYPVYLDVLRESFQKDLVLILPDINRLINDSCMNIVFVHNQEIKIILTDGLYLINEFGQGKHPGEILHNYLSSQAKSESLSKIDQNLYPSLQALDLFSQSLRSKQNNQFWISSDSLKLLFEDTTFQIYMGLIYQQAKLSKSKIIFDKIEFTEYLQDIANNMSPIKNYLTNLISKTGSIEYYFKTIKEKQLAGKDKPSYQDYFSLYDATLNLLEYISVTPTIVNLPILNATDMTLLNSYFTAARSLGNIYIDIYEKQYSSAVVEFSNSYFNLLSSKVQKEIDNTKIKMEDVKVKITNATDYQRKSLENEKDSLNLLIRRLENLKNTSSLILKYGTFAAKIAKAESSDDVQNAIEAVALPAGSSRIKRESRSNVSLNAYCGFYSGKNIAGDWSTGFTAPIGIAASWGIYKHTSLSLFFSIFDLGAPVAFRFSNNSDSIPAIKLADIISPGLFVSWGIRKCPVSINAGCQMTPSLTSVSSKGNTFGTKSLRVTLGLLVDLPLLNLYNKSK